MEQTCSTNYRRYGGVDNKALSEKGKTLIVVSDIVETANVGVEKGKSVAMEEGKGNTYVPNKNNNLKQGLLVLSTTDVERLATVPMNVLSKRQ